MEHYTALAVMVTAVQMRDPLARFHSRYRFNREILPKLQSPAMIREAKNRSTNINQCVATNHPECRYQGTLPRYSGIESCIGHVHVLDIHCIVKVAQAVRA